MDALSDAALIEALRRHMNVAAAREMVAASNLANINTPGYKAQEVDFARTLDRHTDPTLPVAGTDAGHLAASGQPAGPDGGGIAVREAPAGPTQRDGNTVQLERELLTMTRAAGEFAQAQTALAAKFRLLRYAINEGR